MGLVAGCRIELRRRDAGSRWSTKKEVTTSSLREVCTSNVGAGEVGVGQCGSIESGIGKLLAGEVPGREVICTQIDSCQIVRPVAGRRVELRRTKALVRCAAKVGPADLGVREIGFTERGPGEVRICDVLAGEVAAG